MLRARTMRPSLVLLHQAAAAPPPTAAFSARIGGASFMITSRVESYLLHRPYRYRELTLCASSPVADWQSACENSMLSDLRADGTRGGPSREVLGAHYTLVRPEAAPAPELVVFSEGCAELLGLSAEDCESEAFLRLASGDLPEGVESWATAYGVHFSGRYGGQRGDGRAVSIGQLRNGYEVQLKGSGRTPFSRGFDGRAVLRSALREFLASEAMAALGVPTTRALSVVRTGEGVRRQWYDLDGAPTSSVEPGAVAIRVATSFLRFGHLELFWQRDETDLLIEMLRHAQKREFAHLSLQYPTEPFSGLCVKMFEEVCERQAVLVAEWLRVGYVQGNMNSDNAALSGITLDYGPFGFMEAFNPNYSPWVGDGGSYAFARQSHAAAINLAVLSEAFAEAVAWACASEGRSVEDKGELVDAVRRGVSERYVQTFHSAHDENKRKKLGLADWDSEAETLWRELEGLMTRSSGESGIDFTLLFSALAEVQVPEVGSDSTELPGDSGDGSCEEGGVHGAARDLLGRWPAWRRAALDDPSTWPDAHVAAWAEWEQRYRQRVCAEARPAAERLAEMQAANPRYILRNWMATEACEAAARGDYDVLHELAALLRQPYMEQGTDADERWARPTPRWARRLPGVAVMS